MNDAPHTQCQPGCADAPETLLRGWAKAYRDTPEYRFPSDPHAEFFPVDLDFAADTIATLQARVEELTKEKLELADHIDGCVRVAADALRRVDELTKALESAGWQPIKDVPPRGKLAMLLYFPPHVSGSYQQSTLPAMYRTGHPDEYPNRPPSHFMLVEAPAIPLEDRS